MVDGLTERAKKAENRCIELLQDKKEYLKKKDDNNEKVEALEKELAQVKIELNDKDIELKVYIGSQS